MAGTPGEVPLATRTETAVVNAAGLVQGIVLVTFPAASTIFTDADEYGLTSTEYGFMFLPQVVLAVATSLLGAKLAQRFTTKRVYLVGLLSSTISMSLLIVSTLVKTDTSVAYPLLLVATAFLGAGFGLTVPALNVYAGFFHPAAVDRSVLVLNALLGLGTALAPLFVALFVGLGFWWGLPVLSVVLLLGLLYVSLPLPLRTGAATPGVGGGRVGHPDEVLVVRCIRRSLRHLRDHERQLVPAGHDVGAGSLDHPGVTRPDRVLGDGHRWPGAVRVDRPLAARPGHLPHPPRWCWWAPSPSRRSCRTTTRGSASSSSDWRDSAARRCFRCPSASARARCRRCPRVWPAASSRSTRSATASRRSASGRCVDSGRSLSGMLRR